MTSLLARVNREYLAIVSLYRYIYARVRYKIYILILFLLQCCLILKGKYWLGIQLNPFALLLTSLAIALVFFKGMQQTDSRQDMSGSRITGLIAGGVVMSLLIPFFAHTFTEFPKPQDGSDVIPQLDALYNRWRADIFPYYPLESLSWHPYPVYMPLNWLPLSIPHALQIDVRWCGVFALIMANGLLGWAVWNKTANWSVRTLSICLTPLSYVLYLLWNRYDLSVSLETLIAGYYLILAVGLLSRNIWLITIGIILCLLSRYTLIFWLPLFAVLLWVNKPAKTSLYVWGAVLAAVLIIYILPFYSHDPSILTKGIAYHNSCAVAEWEGFGDPEYLGTFEHGIYLAPFIKKALSGSMEHRVFIARTIQAVLMLCLCIGGILAYRKLRHRFHFYDFSLGMLYLFVLVFYMFSPLLYMYYYWPLLMITAVLCTSLLYKNQTRS